MGLISFGIHLPGMVMISLFFRLPKYGFVFSSKNVIQPPVHESDYGAYNHDIHDKKCRGRYDTPCLFSKDFVVHDQSWNDHDQNDERNIPGDVDQR